MIANVIGYTIGALFVIGILAPIGVASWMVYDRVAVLTSTESATATVESCHYKRRKSGSSRTGSWAPVAVTDSGTEVRGSLYWSKKRWCESSIGNRVSVFLHATDAKKNRINTFFQFWFLPGILSLFCITFYPLSYRAKKRQRAAKRSADERATTTSDTSTNDTAAGDAP